MIIFIYYIIYLFIHSIMNDQSIIKSNDTLAEWTGNIEKIEWNDNKHKHEIILKTLTQKDLWSVLTFLTHKQISDLLVKNESAVLEMYEDSTKENTISYEDIKIKYRLDDTTFMQLIETNILNTLFDLMQEDTSSERFNKFYISSLHAQCDLFTLLINNPQYRNTLSEICTKSCRAREMWWRFYDEERDVLWETNQYFEKKIISFTNEEEINEFFAIFSVLFTDKTHLFSLNWTHMYLFDAYESAEKLAKKYWTGNFGKFVAMIVNKQQAIRDLLDKKSKIPEIIDYIGVDTLVTFLNDHNNDYKYVFYYWDTEKSALLDIKDKMEKTMFLQKWFNDANTHDKYFTNPSYHQRKQNNQIRYWIMPSSKTKLEYWNNLSEEECNQLAETIDNSKDAYDLLIMQNAKFKFDPSTVTLLAQKVDKLSLLRIYQSLDYLQRYNEKSNHAEIIKMILWNEFKKQIEKADINKRELYIKSKNK